jgi:hypothetical protein
MLILRSVAKQGQPLSPLTAANAPVNIIYALVILYGKGNGFQGLFQGVPCHPAHPPILACSSLSLGYLTITHKLATLARRAWISSGMAQSLPG